jgi:spore maturation protein CgeB
MNFSPDLILVFGSCAPAACEFVSLKRAANSVGAHLAFWVHEDPYEFDHHTKITGVADTIFTNDRATVSHYSRERVFHLPLAACPDIHYRDVTAMTAKAYDVFFCGVAFPNRLRLFRSLEPILEQYRSYICGRGWPDGRSHIYHNIPVNYFELPNYYACSKVVLNIGRCFDLANRRKIKATTPGPRTFEAAMAGCLQLYSLVSNDISEYFTPNTEIALFKTTCEAEGKIRFLCENQETCLQVAVRAQFRALREHSYVNRVKRVIQLCLSKRHYIETS